MINPFFFEPKNSINLFGLQENFNFLSNLSVKKLLPKVIMITGQKGSGKSTLINHLLFSIFDKENYDKKQNILHDNSKFLKQFKDNSFSNIIYMNGLNFSSIKVDDIRNLKNVIFQSTILNKERFIVLDDIELFNQNSLNALLKIIEEPSKNTYFVLINNKTKPLLKTIKSRALEIKIILNEETRLKIIKKLIDYFKLDLVLDPKNSQLSPGNFIKFNHILKQHEISLTNNLSQNISFLLGLYKKNKDILFISLIFFIVDYHFSDLSKKNILKNDKIYEIRNYIFSNLNKFMQYNINQSALLNAINTKLIYE